jgi:hypothetical protein
MCNDVSFAKPSAANIVKPPAFVRWLAKALPGASLEHVPAEHLRIEIAWMKPKTQEIYPQPLVADRRRILE